MPHALSKPALFAALLLLTLWALRALHQRWGAAGRYYVVIGVTGLWALAGFCAPAGFLGDVPLLGLAFDFGGLLLAFASLRLSLTTLIKPSPVPWWFALPCLLTALPMALFLLVAAATGGSIGLIV